MSNRAERNLSYGIACVVTLIWSGSHIVSWFPESNYAPSPLVHALMAAVVFHFVGRGVAQDMLRKQPPAPPTNARDGGVSQ